MSGVLAVMDKALTASIAGNNFNSPLHLREARDAVAELIEAADAMLVFGRTDSTIVRLRAVLAKAAP